MKLKTKLKDAWINLEATIILIGKRDQKEKEFNKTEIGKQLNYDQDIMLWKSGTYGRPFKQGETIEIDSEIADILLKSGKVEEKKAENGN